MGDSQEPAVEPLKPAADLLVWESAPVHFEEVTCGFDCLTDAGGIGASGAVGNGEYGYLMGQGGMLTGGVELAL